ncbi:YybH family protein [Pedobacter gandavensis]|uniref:YybH family protein n=1 Tax=Pedobacter gandavensis TaxID=2679963 RepID=UPI00292FFF76|nr:DUF4440 domain-containing protein [Pedobacter gandavensis]
MKEQINLRNDQFNHAINKQDGVLLSQLYTADAVLYPPKQDVIHGREAIGLFFNEVFKMGVSKGSFKTIEMVVTADYAFESGEYGLWVAGNQLVAKGFYIYVWQFIEGEWYIISDIWND